MDSGIISGSKQRANAASTLTTTPCKEGIVAEKKCTKCLQILPLERFYQDGRKGYLSECKSCRAQYMRERRAKDPEAYRKWHRDYRARNKDRVRGYREKSRKEKPERAREYVARSRSKDPVRALLNAARSRSRLYGLDFDITHEDVVMPEKCPILGIPFGPNTGRGCGAHSDSPSLDRIDPSKGYVKGNVQVLSRLANTMKSNATREHLLAFSRWIQRKYG